MTSPNTLTMLWTALALAPFAAAAAVDKLTIDPYLTQCEETTISWTGGAPPYSLRFNAGEGDLRDFGNIEETSWKWKCDYPAGTSVFITVYDSSGEKGGPDQSTGWKGRVRMSTGACPLYLVPLKNGSISAPPVIVTQTVQQEGANATAAPGNTSKDNGLSSSSKTPVGAIVGGVVGGVVGALLLLGLLLWNLRLRRKLKGKSSRRDSYENIEDHTESARQTTAAPVTMTTPSRQPATEPAHQPASEPARQSSPPMKIMQLDTMYAPQLSPSLDGSDSPTLPDSSLRSPRTRYTLDATSAPTSTNLHSASLGHGNNLSPVDDTASEYAEDGGPVFPPPARTVHPPQYNATWKS